jgi:type I restriction modification DNA specificity family protein
MNSALKNHATYINNKVDTNEISLSQYISTDNILQNKQGIKCATSLPIQGGKVTSFKKGDILLANIRPYLKKIWYAQFDGGCSADVLAIRANAETDSHFLFYALFRDDFFIHAMKGAKGTKMPRGDKTQIMEFKIPVFDLKTQQSIAAVLSALDKKIALNKQINARLEQMAKTLYDYWFVQFDFPDANGKPYKSSGGEMVFDETLKRKIPKGWEVKQISHWIKTDKSGDWGKEQQEGHYTVKVNCVRGADINAINSQGNIEAPIRFILAKNANKLLSPFDFVVEISGGSPTQSTGRLAPISQYVLKRFDLPLICSNFCKAISLKDTSYFYQFALMWSDIYKNNILFGWEGKTSGIKNLLFDNFVNGYFECFPPKEIAEQFFKIIDKNHQEQQLLLKQNHHLTQLRDFLLPMLMNGQVSVAE